LKETVKFTKYNTTQLQGNSHAHLEFNQDVAEMSALQIRNTSGMRPGQAATGEVLAGRLHWLFNSLICPQMFSLNMI